MNRRTVSDGFSARQTNMLRCSRCKVLQT
jgi:hypothetical protein